MLHLQNYSNFILQNITLDIHSHLTVLGDNGAGKSTLGRVLSGLIKSEKLFIDTKPYNLIPYRDRAKSINYIPAKLDIYDKHITMREYLELSNIRGIDSEPIIEDLKIGYLMAKTQTSLGEASLVLMASALIHGARYTIFDEPTANLDPKRTIQIFKLLQNDTTLRNKIIITHDLNLAHRLGYEILYLQEGKILFQDTCEAFFESENLKTIFGDAITKQEGFYRVNL